MASSTKVSCTADDVADGDGYRYLDACRLDFICGFAGGVLRVAVFAIYTSTMTLIGKIPVIRYVCCECGYVENWVESEIKKAFG